MTSSPTGESLSWLSSLATQVPSSDSQPEGVATGGDAVAVYAAVAIKQGTRSRSSRPASSSEMKRPQSTSSSSDTTVQVSPRRAMSEAKSRRRSVSRSPAVKKPLLEEELLRQDRQVKCHVIGTPPAEREEEPYFHFLHVHPRDRDLRTGWFRDGKTARRGAVTPGTCLNSRPDQLEKGKDT